MLLSSKYVLFVCCFLSYSPMGKAAPRLSKASKLVGTIVLDGRLDESAWQNASVSGDFWQRRPIEGNKPTQSTEFRVLYDDDALYIGIQAMDESPNEIRSILTRRDKDSASDWLSVGIDSYNDKRTAFVFAVSSAGVQKDYLVYDDEKQELGWNAVWESASSIHSKGWSAEFRIPYNQLRFSGEAKQEWGLQVIRLTGRTEEEVSWSPWPTQQPDIVSRFGRLQGVANIASKRNLEVLPYLSLGLGVGPSHTLKHSERVGVDMNYGLTNNISLSATIYPDFGQVEADPSRLNLNAQENFFDEKRPFFLKSQELYRFGLSQGGGQEELYYSRRIGAAPKGSLPASGVGPDLTTIYGALKLSGKTSNGWSFGGLSAITAKEYGYYKEEGETSKKRVTVEPLANYSVLRVRKDLHQGRTSLGFAATSTLRRLPKEELGFLHDRAFTGGFDINHQTPNKHWNLTLSVFGSHVHGSVEALDRTQRSSLRYAHRPGANYLGYDPNKNSLSGFGAKYSMMYSKPIGNWRGGLGGRTRSPGLEVNDLGFQRDADSMTQWLWGQYRDEKAGRWLQRFQINSNAWAVGNYAYQMQHLGIGSNVHGTWKNYWSSELNLDYQSELWSSKKLRGGPSIRGNNNIRGRLRVNSDSRQATTYSISGNGAYSPTSQSWNLSIGPSLHWQARSNLDFTVGPQWGFNREKQQFVIQTEDSRGNAHYLLGELEQQTLSLTLRANYTVTPKLSFQLYAQPFGSTGQYSNFKDVRSPRSRSVEKRLTSIPASIDKKGRYYAYRGEEKELSFGNPDFNFGQLRSNFVLRWEHHPGSTLFAVWSHNQSQSSSESAQSLGRNVRQLLESSAEDVFIIKINYWFVP